MTITRFAPSPTGFLHIGNLRAALFNWAIARKAGGTFILRLDDTDAERSKPEFAEAIQEDLTWLGLTWDRFERQSDRLARYAEVAGMLRERGRLYEVFETPVELELKRKKQLNMGLPPVYDRTGLRLTEAERERLRAEGRKGYWRFLLDQTRIEWTDGILGPLSIDAASVSDPVLIKADGQVLYTFASVVDDVDFGITDIVRGADHVTNTATQIQIIEAMGARPPRFAHHSLLTGPQGEALSKRLGTLSLRDLRREGVEPMAILSLMARLGSSEPVELCTSLDEILEGFDLSTFGAAPTKFDREDLWPLTSRYLAALPFEQVRDAVLAAGVPAPLAEAFWNAVRGNLRTRADIAGWWEVFRDGPRTEVPEADRDFVATALSLLPPPPYDAGTWGAWTEAVKAATGRKGRALYMPLRLALTGRETGPEMAEVMPLLQKVPRPA
ncbi:MAG: glutamate--tRNA ligase [Rhodobacteraceae bacterium]|nr:glutamate--tRNA ligase [Paracoccaceae bacterium]